MRLAIMQPYFLPYVGYFSLIKHTDEFILFDPVQFIRHGFIERNRMLKQTGGWQYISVPVIKESGRDTLIKDVRINNAEPWKAKIKAQIQHYRKVAPYYRQAMGLLDEIFAHEYEDIVHLNQASLKSVCSYLGIERQFPVFSEMNLALEPVNAPDEWALNTCKALGVKEYWNRPGGRDFFDVSKYEAADIDMKFQDVELIPYNQRPDMPFEPGLSILDVLMFNTPGEINAMLDNYSLL